MNFTILFFSILIFGVMVKPIVTFVIYKLDEKKEKEARKKKEKLEKMVRQVASIKQRYHNAMPHKPRPKATPMFELSVSQRKWLRKMKSTADEKYVDEIDKILKKGWYNPKQKLILNQIRKEYIQLRKGNNVLNEMISELDKL